MKNTPNPLEIFVSLVTIWAWWGYMIFVLDWYGSQPTGNRQLLLALTLIGIKGTQVTLHLDTIFDFLIPRLGSFWKIRKVDNKTEESD